MHIPLCVCARARARMCVCVGPVTENGKFQQMQEFR
jgi:hypothetical protein